MPPTVKDAIKTRIKRLKDRRDRSLADAQQAKAEIDTLQASLDALTPGDETKLDQLQQLGVLKAED